MSNRRIFTVEVDLNNPKVKKYHTMYVLEDTGDSGGSGTSDYTDLENKPSINGVTLEGNLTTQEIGVDNHFKGWYASANALPSNPVVGDYAYVKGATSSDPAAIYECNTDGSWSDSDRTVDTNNVQTFASGEEVNETYIDDTNLVNPADGALPTAEDVLQLKAKLDGVTATETKVIPVLNTNYFDGKYVKNDKTIQNGSTPTGGVPNGILVVNVSNVKKVRFLGFERDTTTTASYGFSANPIDPTSTAEQLDYAWAFNGDADSAKAVELEVDVPAGMNYFVCTIYKYGTPSTAVMTLSSFYCYLQSGESVVDDIQKTREELWGTDTVTIGEELVGEGKPISGTPSYSNSIYSTATTADDNIFNRGGRRGCYILNLSDYQGVNKLSFASSSNIRAGVAFFRSTPNKLSSGNYSLNDLISEDLIPQGCTVNEFLINLPSGDITVDIPNWARYVFVVRYWSNFTTEATPTSFRFITKIHTNGDIDELNEDVSDIKNELEKSKRKTTRANVNLCDVETLTTGVINESGEIVDGNGKVSDFLEINLGDNASYQKTQFIHACCIDDNGSFGYNATKIAVYNSAKTFVGLVEDVSSYVDKEDENNITLFQDAKYVRVQFPKSYDSYYVSNTNDRNLQEYSKYNKEDLYQTNEFNADKIHNSDGALTKMIKAALSYVGRGAVTDLGYGDSNTAFDQYVNAVECDSWNPDRYEGSKKQINCSAFVQLALQGISYENSRYVLGSNRQNIITNYVFDSKATYNYHNAVASPDYTGDASPAIYCSDYGKLYANTLAKYAEDRGMLFKIKDDLSNLEVGDVIFSSGTGTAYRGIVHTMFVCDVRPKIDGSKNILVMQVSGRGVENLASMSLVSSRDNDYIWAARFPMPESVIELINIVSAFSSNTLTSITTEEQKISDTITLIGNLRKANVYTVIGKLSSNPLGKIQPIIKVGGTTYGGSSTTYLQRPDGMFVKHIIIKYNDSITNLSQVEVYVKSSEQIDNVSITLDELKVYEGYITL